MTSHERSAYLRDAVVFARCANGARSFFAWLVVGFCCALPVAAQDAPEGHSIELPIYLTIEPEGMQQAVAPDPSAPSQAITGRPVTIRGVTGAASFGKPLRLTITPPSYLPPSDAPEQESPCAEEEGAGIVASGPIKRLPPTVVTLSVSRTGTFQTSYTPPMDGEYEVLAVSGPHRGEQAFEAQTPEFEDECRDIPRQQIEQEASQLRRNVCRLVDVIAERAGQLPASPAKDELRRRLREFHAALREAPDCDAPPPWINGVDHVRELQRIAPRTRKATKGLTRQFDAWLSTAQRTNAEAPRALAQLTTGNVACDQLDIIVNGLKFCDTLLSLAAAPEKWLLDWAKENVPTKLVGMVPAVKRTPALKEGIESAWKGVTTFYEPVRKQGRWSVEGLQGAEKDLGKQKMAYNLVSFAASRVFDVFCEQFQGPVSASMSAELYEGGIVWWTFSIDLQGTLVLRYPKGASGEAIALTGEFVGSATRFKSWDNAVPVLFPGMAKGTVFRTLRIEPFVNADLGPLFGNPLRDAAVGGVELPDPNPLSTTIDQGGLITRYFVTPAFFRVPVRGELRGDVLRIELQPAAVDFDDVSVKVVQILLPVLSMRPTLNEYALPYKGAHFMMNRAMNDGPAQFTVKRTRDSMSIERKFKRERRLPQNKGLYEMSVKACNPGC